MRNTMRIVHSKVTAKLSEEKTKVQSTEIGAKASGSTAFNSDPIEIYSKNTLATIGNYEQITKRETSMSH